VRAPTAVPTRTLVFTLGFVTAAAGYGQFGATSALGNVASAFGIISSQSSLTERAGFAFTTLAAGIAILRLASLGALPLASLADRLGRHRVLMACGVTGLCVTAAASLSPGYWWFVAIFALARPALTAANILTSVVAAELSSPRGRATALAVVVAGAAAGAGLSVLVHGAVKGPNGFRILFATALVPAALVWWLVRRLPETHGPRHEHPGTHAPRLGAIPRELRHRLGVVMAVTAALGAISGPAGGFAFVYMEDYLHLHTATVDLVVTASAIPGIGGLLLGRWLADTKGRRPAVVAGTLATAATSVFAYSGGRPAFVLGYVLGVFAGGLVAPGGAAISTEPFPASHRASAGGWITVAAVAGAIVGLAVFGPVADATGSFGWAAACAFLPGLLVLFYLRTFPETRGRELT
jgi:DHA1 family bicyclomycin/chloramphenicol resistance-like MFS transporter